MCHQDARAFLDLNCRSNCMPSTTNEYPCYNLKLENVHYSLTTPRLWIDVISVNWPVGLVI